MRDGNPDFPAHANAYGAKGSRVTTVEGLAPALESAFCKDGVQLVAAPIDYSENTRVLIDGLRASGCAVPKLIRACAVPRDVAGSVDGKKISSQHSSR